jgi:hypothetical protein
MGVLKLFTYFYINDRISQTVKEEGQEVGWLVI